MKTSNIDLKDPKYKALRLFTMHGAHLNEISGNQAKGDCPFCLKEGHFYVNHEKLLWDCKVCGETGNPASFLNKMVKVYAEGITSKELKAIAEDRGLPTEAFKKWGLGYAHGSYAIPVYSEAGKLLDIRLYKLGGKAMSTAGAKSGLMGAEKLAKFPKTEEVYICEGEWDTIAMQWYIDFLGKKGLAVCSPGAGIFKPEWAELFVGRRVNVMYDNDKAGMKGELTVKERLDGKSFTLKFVHWPDGAAEGYDLRDYILAEAIKRKLPKKSWTLLHSMLMSHPKSTEAEVSPKTEDGLKPAPEVDPSVTLDDFFNYFKTWLHEPDRDAIDLSVIVMLSTFFAGDPIWAFLVAPPSSGKTEIISTFKYLCQPYDEVGYFQGSLTSHSLISGMQTKRGDPSIFAKLQNPRKTLLIKDFTTILSMRQQDKEEVISQLRDAYDGYTHKQFGNGVIREYHDLRFGLLAAVTDQIYEESASFAALGERFAKLYIGRMNDEAYVDKVLTASVNAANFSEDKREKSARLMYSAVKNLLAKMADSGFKLPELNQELKNSIIALTKYVSMMRGVVSRDKYRPGQVKSHPYRELGPRFAKMMAFIASVHAVLYGRDVATMEDFGLVRRVCLDTVNQRDEEILRTIYKANLPDSEVLPIKARLQEVSRYNPQTVAAVMEDMCMLSVLTKKQVGRKLYYSLTDRMAKIVEEAQIYVTKAPNKKIKLKRLK